MRHLFKMAGAFALGYMVVMKGYPYLRAKAETRNLDDVWRALNG